MYVCIRVCVCVCVCVCKRCALFCGPNFFSESSLSILSNFLLFSLFLVRLT